MPILDLQKRQRQLGEIRIGHVVPTSNGKTRPAKLERFRVTSANRALLEPVAELYGGEVQQWSPANGGPDEWEVYTQTDRLPVIIPPQNAVTQWYEMYKSARCVRRCDGRVEQKTDSPCLCDPEARDCQITTRLNVMLRDVPGMGVWLLTSRGYYAAVELPDAAEFLSMTGGYVNGWLSMEEKVIPRENAPSSRFMVPKLDIDASPGEVLAGRAGSAGVSAGQSAPSVASGQEAAPAVAGGQAPALETGAPARDWHAEVEAARSTDALREVWRQAAAAGVQGENLKPLIAEKLDVLQQMEKTGTYTPSTDRPPQLDEQPAAESAAALDVQDTRPDPAAAQAPAPAPAGESVDDVWMQIVTAWPGTTSQLEMTYAERHGGRLPGNASAEELSAFLSDVRGGWVTPDGAAEPVAEAPAESAPASADGPTPF